MSGETNLDQLIASMEPVVAPETYVFCTVTDLEALATVRPRMLFEEEEGLTLIVEKDQAVAAGLAFEFECRMITLNIHSSLEAVGFLAAITPELAALGMGVNPVSAFYHDHLFVPADRVIEAVHSLKSMSQKRA